MSSYSDVLWNILHFVWSVWICFRLLAQLEAAEPIHPDDQLNMLKYIVECEQGLLVREEDIHRVQYYLAEVTKYSSL